MPVIVRYAEVFLKSEYVRRQWEDILVQNIRTAVPGVRVVRKRLRIFLYGDEKKITKVLKYVFGVRSFSIAVECKPDLKDIKNTAVKLVKKGTFAVRTNRADKQFPMPSQKISGSVGAFIVEKKGNKVNLSKPQQTISIEILKGLAFVYTNAIDGPGGLPVGVSGEVVLLPGKQAAAAGWMMLKRGCTLKVVGKKIPKLEAWSLGRKVRYVKEVPRNALALVAPDNRIRKADVPVFYPLLGKKLTKTILP